MAPKKKTGATAAPTTFKLPSQASGDGAGGAVGAGAMVGTAGAGGTGGAGVKHPHRAGDRSQHTRDGADSQLRQPAGEHDRPSITIRTGVNQDPIAVTFKGGAATSKDGAATSCAATIARLARHADVYYTTYSCRLVLGLQAQSFVGQ
jgi:hypothetical protein